MPDLRQIIEEFLASCREPVLCEPGEESLAITADTFKLETRNGSLSLQAWDERRNLVRRIARIERQSRGKLVLETERFGKKRGTLSLIDLRLPAHENMALRSARWEFREQFHRFLRRQFPTYKIVELTTEADLEHSLSPAYPRALLRKGASGWAAIGAPRGGFSIDGVLTFGLIWLDYLRDREPSLAVHGLVLYLPAGHEKITCLRLLFLNPELAQYLPFVYNEQQLETQIDLADYGNLDTRLEAVQRRLPSALDLTLRPLAAIDAVETIDLAGGELSFRVRGLEFARTAGDNLLFGIDKKRRASNHHLAEIRRLAEELGRFRSSGASDRQNPLYLRSPEAWLESQVRANVEAIDPNLVAALLYGQVPAFAAADRGVLDLVAVDRSGRLAVIELKASEDIHLPLQALDYWMRVKWHLDRREFSARGYFPGMELRSDPPRLLLVAPALDYHPSNERVLRFFTPRIEVQRIGVGLEWRKELKVMFRS